MIKATNLSYGFPQKDLYENISFTLEENRHCALIGSNGSGKTTLAELIRSPENLLFDGTLLRENVGRIGYVTQFAGREKNQSITASAYLLQDFQSLQQEMADVCTQMESAEDLDALLERYQQLLDEQDAMDADNCELNIRRQLQLAELADKADLSLSLLSGGEYKLLQVIRQMLRRPGLLIMDEPDVFLDFENLNGLRDLINHYHGTLLVITHSRFLLNHCFDQIWHLENGDLQEFDGSFQEYNCSLLQRKIELQEIAAAGAAEIERAQKMVERLRKEATEVIDPVKGRALKGKVSYLERQKARQIKPPFVEIQRPDIHFPTPAPIPEDAVLLQVNDYHLSFEKTLLAHVTFALHAGQKTAIVGPNGTGKTSLLREIKAGIHPAIQYSPEANVGFFSQLQEEALCEAHTIREEFAEFDFESPSDLEAYLARYCFAPQGLHRKIAQLSGGEKNLLQLAKLALGEKNLLLLDEPSSHLDTFAQIALEKAISAYEGAVLMVSHDFYTIANCMDSILFVEDGTLRPMSIRAFRKMIYKHHFSKDYLELEARKKELETRIARSLEKGDTDQAKLLFEELEPIVAAMK